MRVVLVSSISGGTGSGMIADLGYLARHLLADMGFRDDNVCAVLTHSTGHNPRETELAVVNAYATLSELNHYGRLGSYYPGERACRVPPRKDDNVAFRDTYLVDLGTGLNEQQFDDAADKVSTVPVPGHHHQCRGLLPGLPRCRTATIRTRGMRRFACARSACTSSAACRTTS